MNSVPWKVLDEKNNYKDYKELAFKEMIKGKKFSVISSQLNFVPDLVLSAGFTKRSNLDGRDFVVTCIFFLTSFIRKYSK